MYFFSKKEKDSIMQPAQEDTAKNVEIPANMNLKDEDEENQLEQKRKRTFWVTRTMAEEFSREDVLRTTLREALIFVVFVISVTLNTIVRRSLSMFYLTQALKGQLIFKEFEGPNGISLTFEDVTTISEFWEYTTTTLMDTLYVEGSKDEDNNDDNDNDSLEGILRDEAKLLYENKMIGVPRIRQVRVTDNSCNVHEKFRSWFSTCYNTYGEKMEDRTSFGPAKGTAWNFNSPEKTGSIPYKGHISTYQGGGYYQDFTKDKNETLQMLLSLKEQMWITRSSRVVFIDFSLYNANINLFCICKLIFEIPPTGGVRPHHSLRAVKMLYFLDRWDYVTFGAEIVTYVITIYYLLEEIREMVHFKHRYFAQFWSYMDLTNIAMALGKFATSLTIFPTAVNTLTKIGEHKNDYANLEHLGKIKRYNNNFAALLLFFSYMKLFKYLNFNKVMGQLNNTMRRCALDLIGFSIMFFVIFFAYAQLGHVVFGTVVEDFSTFGIAMFTLLRTVLGDFDYDEIEKANGVIAPIYFLTYIFLVFFVLLNMFLAIINDTYADVKTEIAVTPDELQMSDYIKRCIYNMLQKCGCKAKMKEKETETTDINQQIREILRKCKFNDLEIEMFFARYNVDPLAEISDYDLKEILRELEGHKSILAKEKLDAQQANLYLAEFRQQQERLNRVENRIRAIVSQADIVLRKLEQLQAGRR